MISGIAVYLTAGVLLGIIGYAGYYFSRKLFTRILKDKKSRKERLR